MDLDHVDPPPAARIRKPLVFLNLISAVPRLESLDFSWPKKAGWRMVNISWFDFTIQPCLVGNVCFHGKTRHFMV
jgi:hypothetical protein